VSLVVEFVELIVSPDAFFLCFFLCFVVLVPLVSLIVFWLWLLLFDVFCAKTAVQGSSESPSAAIMIFFILGISPC
jgi:hypothetical protein